jgi:hypothetical protein
MMVGIRRSFRPETPDNPGMNRNEKRLKCAYPVDGIAECNNAKKNPVEKS